MDGFFADCSRPADASAFVQRFREAYKDERGPTLLDAIGYDSGPHAAADHGQERRRRPAPRCATRSPAMKDFDGATGTTSFNDKREAEKPLFFLTIDPKGIREIQPTDRLSGS